MSFDMLLDQIKKSTAMLSFSVLSVFYFFIVATGLVVNNAKPSDAIGGQSIASFHSFGGQQRYSH